MTPSTTRMLIGQGSIYLVLVEPVSSWSAHCEAQFIVVNSSLS